MIFKHLALCLESKEQWSQLGFVPADAMDWRHKLVFCATQLLYTKSLDHNRPLSNVWCNAKYMYQYPNTVGRKILKDIKFLLPGWNFGWTCTTRILYACSTHSTCGYYFLRVAFNFAQNFQLCGYYSRAASLWSIFASLKCIWAPPLIEIRWYSTLMHYVALEVYTGIIFQDCHIYIPYYTS